MVRRALLAITAKISGLQKAAFWLATFSALSLILGFLRDRILTHYFGAGVELDMYYAAFEIPDILFATVASLASASILLPIFSEKKDNPGELQKFVNGIFSSFSVILFASSLLAFIFMPHLVKMFFGGFTAEKLAEVVFFSRIIICSPLFLGLSNFFGSIVQFERRFLLYALSPLFYNFGIIGGLLLGIDRLGILSGVLGVAVGAFLHMLVQGFFVFSSKEAPRFTLHIFNKEVRKTFLLSVPRTISLSASSLVGLFFVILASRLPEGSIAAFTLALNLQSILLSLIGASFSLAAFPPLAMHYAKNEISELTICLSQGLRYIIFWAVPASALFIVLRAHIVRTVLGSGAFDWSDTRITAAALGLFVVSIVFQSAQLFLTRAHYAFGKTKTPLIMNVCGAVATALLAILLFENQSVFDAFVKPISILLKAEDLSRLPVLVLPFSFSIGATFSAILLFISLGRILKSEILMPILETFGDAFIAAASLVFTIAIALRVFNDYFLLDTVFSVFMHGLLSGLCGIAAWVLTLYLLKNQELKEIMKK